MCPNCNRDIEPGTGHYAIVPKEALTCVGTGTEAGTAARPARTHEEEGVSAQHRTAAARSERRFDDLDAWTGDRGDIESETTMSTVGVEP